MNTLKRGVNKRNFKAQFAFVKVKQTRLGAL